MFELNKKNLRNLFFLVAGGIFLYWLLHEKEQVMNIWDLIMRMVSPFITGAAIAFVLNVPMRAFEKLFRKIPNQALRRTIAVILTIICLLLVLTGVFLLLIPQLIETVQTLIPRLTAFFVGLQEQGLEFLNANPELMEWVNENVDIAGFLENFDFAGLAQKALDFLGNSLSTILSQAFSAIGTVASGLVSLVISVVFALYCLFQKETLARQGRKLLYAFLPEKAADYIVRVLRLSNATFSNFLSGQCIEVCILGSLFAVCMTIFGMPYAALVSVLIAVTAFIPIVGAFIGCSVGAFLIMVHDPMLAVWFVIMFLILQQFENNVIYPRVVGTSIGLSGMWVLVAVSVGGELFGVAGMFLMIPMSSVIYTLLREHTANRLENREVAQDKLQDHPPELKSKFKEKREKNKAKQDSKKATENADKK